MQSMRKIIRVLAILALILVAAPTAALAQQVQQQMRFASADDAVQGLYEAVKSQDRKKIVAVVGARAVEWIYSGDAVADRNASEKFAAAYQERHALEARGDDRMELVVGKDSYPFPFPIVRVAGRWSFDAEQGKQELLKRRIGRNELDTIEVVLAIVDAQRDYAAQARDGRRTLQFAQNIVSAPGKQDGLYWPTKAGEPPSPLGSLVAAAVREGYALPSGPKAQPTPYHGYFFRILKEQGKDAPGGAYSYVANGRMIGGFAVLAYPATYANSGVMSFIISADGIVYAKDLGPNTAAAAAALRAYNPDSTWIKQ